MTHKTISFRTVFRSILILVLFLPTIGEAAGQSGVYIFFPLVIKPPLSIHGRVTLNGLPAGDVAVRLRYFDGDVWYTRMSTNTAADGSYAFLHLAKLGDLEKYDVYYENTAGSAGLLAYWKTAMIGSDFTGSELVIEPFDIADVELIAPEDGSTVLLPTTFQWTPRPATPADNYRLVIFKTYDSEPDFLTGGLGYTGSYDLTMLPDEFDCGCQYQWFISVESPDGGRGASHHRHAIRFSTGMP